MTVDPDVISQYLYELQANKINLVGKISEHNTGFNTHMYVKDYIAQNRVIVFPYRKMSKSAAALAEHFHYKIVNYTMQATLKLDDDPYVLVNWGSRNIPAAYMNRENVHILNKPACVTVASDKTLFFQEAQKYGLRVPSWTTDFSQAMSWIGEGYEVLGRDSIGKGGTDIVFASDDLSEFANKQLWTVYKKKKDEYRVHVFRDKIIDAQRKAVRTTDADGNEIDTSQIDFRVRNLANGFVFVKTNVTLPAEVMLQAIHAVRMCCLDFGAVDIIWNDHEQKAYVLEVNTAPGLEGSTVHSYVKAIETAKENIVCA